MSGALAQRYHGWDNRAKQRLEKSGLKVNKKDGATRAKHGYYSLSVNIHKCKVNSDMQFFVESRLKTV